MHRLFSTSAMALILTAAPAVAQTTTPTTPGTMTGQGAMNQEMMNPNAMGQNTGQSTMNQGTMGQGAVNQGTVNQGTVNQGNVNQGGVNQGTMGTTGQGTMDNTAPVPSDQMGTTQAGMGTAGQGSAGMGMGSTTTADQTGTTTASDGPTSPDGSPAFGIEPYFGIVGGYNHFDRDWVNGVRGPRYNGWLIGGVVGINIPLGPLFVGVEGHGARGFADIRWEYGVRGRGGVRVGDSGLFYASAGYTWSDALNRRGFPDRKDWMWGIGAEFGPRDIGLGGVTSRSGPRFRLAVETADFNSIRPTAGVIFHF